MSQQCAAHWARQRGRETQVSSSNNQILWILSFNNTYYCQAQNRGWPHLFQEVKEVQEDKEVQPRGRSRHEAAARLQGGQARRLCGSPGMNILLKNKQEKNRWFEKLILAIKWFILFAMQLFSAHKSESLLFRHRNINSFSAKYLHLARSHLRQLGLTSDPALGCVTAPNSG